MYYFLDFVSFICYSLFMYFLNKKNMISKIKSLIYLISIPLFLTHCPLTNNGDVDWTDVNGNAIQSRYYTVTFSSVPSSIYVATPGFTGTTMNLYGQLVVRITDQNGSPVSGISLSTALYTDSSCQTSDSTNYYLYGTASSDETGTAYFGTVSLKYGPSASGGNYYLQVYGEGGQNVTPACYGTNAIYIH